MNNAQRIVNELLEAMSRRGFFGLLGRAAAGVAAAPALLAAAAPAPVAAAAAAPVWTTAMQVTLNQIREFFMDSRVNGFVDPKTGIQHSPVPIKTAIARWDRAFPMFAEQVRKLATDPAMVARFRMEPAEPLPAGPQPWGSAGREGWKSEIPARKPQAKPRAQAPAQPATSPALAQKSKKAKRVWPPRAKRQSDEEAPWPETEQESVNKMKAQLMVDALLESDVEGWEKKHAAMRDLWKKHLQSRELMQQLAVSMTYHRALARAGLRKKDVENQIFGGQVGATDNYKKFPAHELRGRMQQHVVGVQTKDGRTVWFDEPVSKTPWQDWKD